MLIYAGQALFTNNGPDRTLRFRVLQRSRAHMQQEIIIVTTILWLTDLTGLNIEYRHLFYKFFFFF